MELGCNEVKHEAWRESKPAEKTKNYHQATGNSRFAEVVAQCVTRHHIHNRQKGFIPLQGNKVFLHVIVNVTVSGWWELFAVADAVK